MHWWGKLSPLPLGTEFKSAKDPYFSSSMCWFSWSVSKFPRSNKQCPSYIILSGLPWKIALHQKPSSSSSASTNSWSILMRGFMELSYDLSFLVVTILASTFQFVSSKSLYRERSQDFPGVRTIFKTYPNFLLSSLVTFPHYICSVGWTHYEMYKT